MLRNMIFTGLQLKRIDRFIINLVAQNNACVSINTYKLLLKYCKELYILRNYKILLIRIIVRS